MSTTRHLAAVLAFFTCLGCGGEPVQVDEPEAAQPGHGGGTSTGTSVAPDVDDDALDPGTAPETAEKDPPPETFDETPAPQLTFEQKTALDKQAKLKFDEVEKALEKFEKYELDSNKEPADLAEQIKKMQQTTADLVAKYTEVLEVGSPSWSVAALFRTGYCYELTAKKLRDAPIPKSFSKLPEEIALDAIEQYEKTVDEMVGPIDEKARTAYALAVEVAQEAGIDDKWAKDAAEHLEAMQDPPTGGE